MDPPLGKPNPSDEVEGQHCSSAIEKTVKKHRLHSETVDSESEHNVSVPETDAQPLLSTILDNDSQSNPRSTRSDEVSAPACRPLEIEHACSNNLNTVPNLANLSNSAVDPRKSEAATCRLSAAAKATVALVQQALAASEKTFHVNLFVESGTGSQVWQDRGIGVLSVQLVRDDTDCELIITSRNGTVLLEQRVCADLEDFALQSRSRIIACVHNRDKVHVSISFAARRGCQLIWNVISTVRPDASFIDSDEEDQEDQEDQDEDSSELLSLDRHRYANDDDKVSDGDDDETDIGRRLNRSKFGGVLATASYGYGASARFPFANSGLPAPPTSGPAILALLDQLRKLDSQDCAEGFHEEMTTLLKHITGERWLTALWTLLDSAIAREEHDSICAAVAEFLSRIVAVYTAIANPFIQIALPGAKGTGPRYLDPHDPLVILLSDLHYEHFFNAMRYEPELRRHAVELDHVTFLKERATFRGVLCENDDSFRYTAKLLYRILYLRDVCLPRHLDEANMQRLSIIINSGYASLCRLIQSTEGALKSLKSLLPNDLQAARFLQQLLTVLRANVCAVGEKTAVYAALKSDGILESLEGYLTGNCPAAIDWRNRFDRFTPTTVDTVMAAPASTRVEPVVMCKSANEPAGNEEVMRPGLASGPGAKKSADGSRSGRHRDFFLNYENMSIPKLPELAVDILFLAVEHSPALLRHALLSAVDSAGRPSLWLALTTVFSICDNEALQMVVAELFRRAVDTSTLDSPDRDDVLGLFYDSGVIDRLVEIVLTPMPTTFEQLKQDSLKPVPQYFHPNLLHMGPGDPDYAFELSLRAKRHQSCSNKKCDSGAPVCKTSDNNEASADSSFDPSVSRSASLAANHLINTPIAVARPSASAGNRTRPGSPSSFPPPKRRRSSVSSLDTSSPSTSPPESDRSSIFLSPILGLNLDSAAESDASAPESLDGPVTHGGPGPPSSARNDTTPASTPSDYDPTIITAMTPPRSTVFNSNTNEDSTRKGGRRSLDTAFPSVGPSPGNVSSRPHSALLSSLPTISCDGDFRLYDIFLEENSDLLSEELKQECLQRARAQLSFARTQITEILSFCVLVHASRMKIRNLENSLHLRLLETACSPIFDSSLALYAVKYLKACLLGDQYHKVFVQSDAFGPIFLILCSSDLIPKPMNRGDGSLLESCILDLLSVICQLSKSQKHIAAILKYIAERYGAEIRALDYHYRTHCGNYDLFRQLQAQYRSLAPVSSTAGSSGNRSAATIPSKEMWSAAAATASANALDSRISAQEDECLRQESYFDDDEDGRNTDGDLSDNSTWSAFAPSLLLSKREFAGGDDEDDVPQFFRKPV